MQHESISFAKLRDESWGVRIATTGTHPAPGDEVVVPKRSGEHKRVKLGPIVDRDQGAFPGPAVYYGLAGKSNGRNGNGNGTRRPTHYEAAVAALEAKIAERETPNDATAEVYDATTAGLLVALAIVRKVAQD